MTKPDLKSAGPWVEESSSSFGNFYFTGCWLLGSVGLEFILIRQGDLFIAQIDSTD